MIFSFARIEQSQVGPNRVGRTCIGPSPISLTNWPNSKGCAPNFLTTLVVQDYVKYWDCLRVLQGGGEGVWVLGILGFVVVVVQTVQGARASVPARTYHARNEKATLEASATKWLKTDALPCTDRSLASDARNQPTPMRGKRFGGTPTSSSCGPDPGRINLFRR